MVGLSPVAPDPGHSCGDRRRTILAAGVAGDESLLLRHRTYIDYADTYHNTYLVVARIGRVLVVVADVGWETGSGHEPLVRELSTLAVHRAAIPNRFEEKSTVY